MTKRLVIYHGHCLDGFTAAWAAYQSPLWRDAEFYAASYQQPPPEVFNRFVLVVDFSYPRDVMLAMQQVASGLSVLDHHKTAKEALDGLPFATFDMDRSGAGPLTSSVQAHPLGCRPAPMTIKECGVKHVVGGASATTRGTCRLYMRRSFAGCRHASRPAS